MHNLLLKAVEQGHLRYVDAYFAIMIGNNNEPAVMLAAALVSKDAGMGHVCLPISHLVIDNTTPISIRNCFNAIGTKLDWHNILLNSSAVSKEGDNSTPLILSREHLYLNRFWHSEKIVANFFINKNQQIHYNKKIFKQILNRLFDNDEEINWQKVAVAIALTRRISVISGGPGTGKTTVIGKLLAVFMQLNGDRKCNIQLVAPTGKAAAQLTKSLHNSMKYIKLTESQLKSFPNRAYTLHYLLGAKHNRQHLRYHASNLLQVDLLIVDEASMIDLIMMSKLIDALPPNAQIIYFGDHNQLTSVEVGSVLKDICNCTNNNYSTLRIMELIQLTGYDALMRYNSSIGNELHDSISLLQKNYRFDKNSGISQLAAAVNSGDYHAVQKIFNLNIKDVTKKSIHNIEAYLIMLEEVIEGYQSFLMQIQQEASPLSIINAFNKYQLLCALHKGSFGDIELNKNFEQLLVQKHYIKKFIHSQWYEGRPIIISRNSKTLGLVTGDIGIALNREKQGLRVWFHLSDNSIKSIHPNLLPKHETAWAITVHKSQGSEFDHVALILPLETYPVITRELIYTAITRARRQISLYTNDNILNKAITSSVERRSGLAEMLVKHDLHNKVKTL